MSDKKVNWDGMYKGALRGLRAPKGASYSSRKEQIAQSYEKLEKAQAEQARFKALEPLLKQSLLEHMALRKPITVLQPMTYITEGLEKAEDMDEIDRKFYNQPQNSERVSQYKILHKSIAPGTVLTFHKINQSLGQWIFKSSTGEEIEIYDKPVIMIGPEKVVNNPGFWGLLCATNIYTDITENSNDENE